MATALRIYSIRPKAGGKVRLVKAPHSAQALRHIAADTYDCAVATQDELVAALTAGAKVELTGDAALAEATQRDEQQLPTT